MCVHEFWSTLLAANIEKCPLVFIVSTRPSAYVPASYKHTIAVETPADSGVSQRDPNVSISCTVVEVALVPHLPLHSKKVAILATQKDACPSPAFESNGWAVLCFFTSQLLASTLHPASTLPWPCFLI